MNDWEHYEDEAAARARENAEVLVLFQRALEESGLSPKTIRVHLRNISIYLNEYLQRDRPRSFADGASAAALDDFFCYYDTQKCLWTTPASLKTTAASIRKFYRCMLDAGRIRREAFQEVSDTIRLNMPDWQKRLGIF